MGEEGQNEGEGQLSGNGTRDDEHTVSPRTTSQTTAAASLGFRVILSSPHFGAWLPPQLPQAPQPLQRFRSSGSPGFQANVE